MGIGGKTIERRTWYETVQEDLERLNLEEELAQDGQEWRKAIQRLTLPDEENENIVASTSTQRVKFSRSDPVSANTHDDGYSNINKYLCTPDPFERKAPTFESTL